MLPFAVDVLCICKYVYVLVEYTLANHTQTHKWTTTRLSVSRILASRYQGLVKCFNAAIYTAIHNYAEMHARSYLWVLDKRLAAVNKCT